MYHFGTSAIYTPTGDTIKKFTPLYICATCAYDTENMALLIWQWDLWCHCFMKRAFLQVLQVILFPKALKYPYPLCAHGYLHMILL